MKAGMKKRRSFELIIGAGILVLLILLWIAVNFFGLGPDPYASGDVPNAGPSGDNLLGTDNLGRDTFARLGVALGSTIRISLVVTVIATVLGVAMGLAAGYGNRWADTIIMRGCEVILAIPAVLMALMARVIFGPGEWPMVLAMALVYAPVIARVVRAGTLALRNRDFVLAAEMAGRPKIVIALRHILPNSFTPVLIQAAATASEVVLLEAALSYLGQGVQPPAPSLGRMISEFQKYLQTDPLLIILPAILIVLISIGWNLIADGLQSISNRNRTIDLTPADHVLISALPVRAKALTGMVNERKGKRE